jgi:hypothetical protein
MKALRAEKGVIRANSTPCYGNSILAEAKTRPGKLPEAVLVRNVAILVPETEANDVFEFVCQKANLDRPNGGVVFQSPAPLCTSYALPEGVPDEMN